MSAEAIAIVGAAVGLLAVLVLVLLTLNRRIEVLAGEMGEMRRDLGDRVNGLVERVARIETRMQTVEAGIEALDARTGRLETTTLALVERVARIEGALIGPWRPANGAPPAPAAPEVEA